MTLRLLIDEGISRDVVAALTAQGYQVEHVIDIGLKRQGDWLVFHEAQVRQAVICTSNRRDFEMLAQAWNARGLGVHQGVITPRRNRQPSPDEWTQELQRILMASPTLTNRVVCI